MLANLIADVRVALRTLRIHPRFALLAVLVYAVGIGSNTAMFTVVDDVLLDPLPFAESDRVVVIWERHPERGLEQVPPAPAKLMEWRAREDLFQRVSSYRSGAMDFDSPEGPDRLQVGLAFADYFRVLGVEPVVGRTFTADELQPGGDRVLLLSNAFWTSRMGRAPDVVGRSLTLDGEPHEVVGVLPPGAAYPQGLDVVKPMVIENAPSRVAHGYRVLAQLAPGVTVEHARRELVAMAERNAVEHADTDAGWTVAVTPLRDQIVGGLGRSLLLFQGALTFVLLIACANVASLLLVRASGRTREMAVRTSLGATRWRLVAQVVTESLLLALLGGGLGLLLSRWGVLALLALSPVELPGASGGGFDGTVYLFALIVSMVSGVVFGVLPALRGTGGDVMGAIRESGSTAGRRRATLRRGIVVGEIALATLLLLGSGLFLRSLWALNAVDPGFRAAGVVTGEVRAPFYRYGTSSSRAQLYSRLVDELGSRPGVVQAGAVSYLPMGGRWEAFRFRIQGQDVAAFSDLNVAEIRSVSDGYFDAVGMQVLEGRGIEGTDGADTEAVAVVNRAMALRFWPDGSPVDERFSISGDEGPWIRIVGVVEDVRHFGLEEDARPEMYLPMTQEPWPSMNLVARVQGDPGTFAGTLRSVAVAVDPSLPVADIRPLEALVDRARAPWRFQAVLVAVFAAVAGLLAAIGVYGLLDYVVKERGTELSIRTALGARAADVRRLVARDAMGLTVTGVGLGLLAGLLLTRVVRSMLFGVDPLDPLSYAGAALLLGAVALAAAWLPARRATRADPAGVLRSS